MRRKSHTKSFYTILKFIKFSKRILFFKFKKFNKEYKEEKERGKQLEIGHHKEKFENGN